ncbi:hypothetical protein Calag_1531 [Caldisphaera lagunensis DSM 15908]|uniref:RNA-binding protein n=1 Tax=Caldisphaera lagunensis (strain DSM 15908 / JCM 11604 / ANMR 0165 / IC-154) TaxID=1056495 RepID=L0ADV5_CALLD|nr:putative RNA uridine N3 methyltransferase [Caldisphaera lagunensis]AFZ71230.1 hypothetical protein Calag_1531 [Caldisphaera lagunensis DSM 15908]
MSCNEFPPKKRNKKLLVLLPISVLSVEDSLIDKTYKAGFISRILSIYKVDEVILYRDDESNSFDEKFLQLILNYQIIPPHIKKKIIKKSKLLKYAGILPPLRLVNHDPPKKAEIGKILDGYVEKCDENYCIVYLGMIGNGYLDKKEVDDKIITVKIKSIKNKIMLEKASWGNLYTGYKVSKIKNLDIKKFKDEGYLIVGTSKLGECFNDKIKEEIDNKLRNSKGIVFVFGGPHAELYNEKEFDYILNTVLNQGTLTVRTEEALASTLAIFNYISNC